MRFLTKITLKLPQNSQKPLCMKFVMYVYFFIKCVVRWSENSVRFENPMGIGFQMGQILWDFISQCEIWHVRRKSIQEEENAEQLLSSTPHSYQRFWYYSIAGVINLLLQNVRRHDKTNKLACVPSKDSDQPGHPPSLIRVFTVRMRKPWVLG